MRTLTNNEMNVIAGGCSNKGYSFSNIVSNTANGCIVGLFFPNIATVLGITSVITNPVLATGALFAGYSLTMMSANALDHYFQMVSEETTLTAEIA